MVKILYIEDDDQMRRLVPKFLPNLQLNLKIYSDGETPYQDIQEGIEYDVLITDLALKDRTADKILELSKRLHPNTPIITLSGSYKKPIESDLHLHKLTLDFKKLEEKVNEITKKKD